MANVPVFESREALGALVGADEPDDMLSVVVGLDRLINRLHAARAVAVDLARREAEARVASSPSRVRAGESRSAESVALGQRAFRADVASALNVSERSAESLIGNAAVLCSELPSTLEALGTGAISYRHATVMVEQTSCLELAAKAMLEQAVLGKASTFTPPKFARAVRVARERLNPESIAERHEKARSERGMLIDDLADGMSMLEITLASPLAHAIFNRITEAAVGVRHGADERTLDQRRADVFVGVMLAEAGARSFEFVPDEGDGNEFTTWFRAITAQVVVSVPVLTLLGQSNETGTLEGRVPIDPETARRLAGRAKSFIRILTHPETGATLSVGRTRYKVPKDLKTYLRIRDLTCRFPGCSMRAARCDIDHTLDWQFDGETAHDNLAHLCRGHHTLKGATDWSVAQSSANAGVLTWRSPSGREFVSRPENPIAS
jgi:hypothetical protein